MKEARATYRPSTIDLSSVRIVNAEELDTVVPGLYLVGRDGQVLTKMPSEASYDIETDVVEPPPSVGPPPQLVLLARVRHAKGRRLPQGVHRAYVRPDGLQVIQQWGMVRR